MIKGELAIACVSVTIKEILINLNAHSKYFYFQLILNQITASTFHYNYNATNVSAAAYISVNDNLAQY